MKNEFRTSDFGLAASLVAEGHQIINFDRSNPKRVEFIFIATEKLTEDMNAFWNDSLRISPQRLLAAQKFLKNRLYSIL